MVSRGLLYASHRSCFVYMYVCLNENKERRITHTIYGKQKKKICIKEEKRQNLHLANKMFYVVLYTIAALLLLGCKRKQKKDLLVFFYIKMSSSTATLQQHKKSVTQFISLKIINILLERRARCFLAESYRMVQSALCIYWYTCLYLQRATFHCKVVFTF